MANSHELMVELREDLVVLVNAQSAFESMAIVMARKDAISDSLADVWNSHLDLRERLLNKILANPLMQQAGLEQSLLQVLNKRKQK